MSKGDYFPVSLNSDYKQTDAADDINSCLNDGNETSPKVSALNVDFYKSYFDVDTHQVLKRLFCALCPIGSRFSLSASLQPQPDLYGPFWVTTTLIFAVAFSGSVHDFLISKETSNLSTFNFTRVTISAAILFIYWGVVPLLISSLIWFKKGRKAPDQHFLTDEDEEVHLGNLFTQFSSLYGYSLTAFVPACLLLMIPVPALQYLVLGLATLISLVALTSAAWPLFKQYKRKRAVALITFLIVMHITMIICLSVVYFHQTTAAPPAAPLVPKADGEQKSVRITPVKINGNNSSMVETIKQVDLDKTPKQL